ncbi:class I SAM-dependent methyltransferase [bacterium]|nr:class I SAM-dependent methyltransferase [bacterium]
MERQPELIEGVFDDPEWARAYAGRSAKRNRRMGRLYAKQLEGIGYAGGPILDTGCGGGELVIELAKAFPDLELTGLDLSPELVKIAEERAGEEGPFSNLRFEVGDATRMPFPDGSFGMVICQDVLQIVEDPVALVNELERVLQPGGRLSIASLKRSWLAVFIRPLRFAYTVPEAREILKKSRLRPYGIIERGIYFVVVTPLE